MIKIKERCLLAEISVVVLLDLEVGSTFCVCLASEVERTSQCSGITTKNTQPPCLYLNSRHSNLVTRKIEDKPAEFFKYHLNLWKHYGMLTFLGYGAIFFLAHPPCSPDDYLHIMNPKT